MEEGGVGQPSDLLWWVDAPGTDREVGSRHSHDAMNAVVLASSHLGVAS